VTDADRAAVLAAIDSGWVAPAGPEIPAFEADLAATAGTAHAVALSSGTAGLHLALVVLGVGPGDDVLVADLTFAASANAVRYVGARPVFVDCDASSWTIDADLVADELKRRAAAGSLPKALITVDLYGQCADYDRINQTCDEFGVPVIEDAAEAIGANYRGRPAGSFGAMAVFSFNGNKIITTSGGGALVTDNEAWAAEVANLSQQAREPTVDYLHTKIGFNYRLSNLLAALGRSQLTQLDERIAGKRAINAGYRELLGDLPGIEFMPDAGWGDPIWWLTCITIDRAQFGATRDDVMARLEEHDIESRPTWRPMHLQPVFAGAPVIGGAVSAAIFERGLCLPSGSSMSDADLERVASLVRSVP
jgi:dTDP-4-amino-4,6-dideoxygalactose transaminase